MANVESAYQKVTKLVQQETEVRTDHENIYLLVYELYGLTEVEIRIVEGEHE